MLSLRPYKACDAKYIASWITDELVFYQWSAGLISTYPMTAEALNGYYDKEKDNTGYWQMTAYDEDKLPAGHMIMRFIDEDRRKLRFGFIIMNPKLRGKGYGKEMLHLAIRYGFDILHVDEISLGVFENNKKAFYCYQAIGFKEVQKERKQYRINGEDWDCIEMKFKKD